MKGQSIPALLLAAALLTASLTACGKQEAASSEPPPDSVSAGDITEPAGPSEDGTTVPTGEEPITPATTTGTTGTRPTAAPPNAGGISTAAVMVGDPNFKPGSLYKLPTIAFRGDGDKATLGMWCWDTKILIRPDPDTGLTCDMMLDMMIQNHITELYLNLRHMLDFETQLEQDGVVDEGYVTEMQVRGFVKKCAKYGIRVSGLTGIAGDNAIDWMKGDYRETRLFIETLANMNSRAESEDEKIYAVHLDVEPAWDKGEGLIRNRQYAADYFTAMRSLCDREGLELEYDINAWARDEEMVRDENGNTVPFLDLLTRKCHSLAVMAYRPKATDQYDIAENELNFAKKNGCRIVVGSETMNPKDLAAGEKGITYYRVGAAAMSEEQQALRQMLESAGCAAYGGAIHHATSFYAMMRERP